MSGPKLTATVVFGTLSFVFGGLFTAGLNGVPVAIIVGLLMAAATATFIFFAGTGRHAFARGFLGLGVVFIVVPIAALAGLGQQVADGTLPVLQGTGQLTEDDAAWLFVSSIVASAGLIFGIVVGLLLVLIGGLMHRKRQPPGERMTK